MSSFVLTQIEASIDLFTSLIEHGARTQRYKSNLQWLINLRTRALSKISEASAAHANNGQQAAGAGRRGSPGEEEGHSEQEEDVELIGWRTRLIERAGRGREAVIRTIRFLDTPSDLQDMDLEHMPVNEVHSRNQPGTSEVACTSVPLSADTFESTNDLVSLTRTLLICHHN